MKKYKIFDSGLSFRNRIRILYGYFLILIKRCFYKTEFGRKIFWDQYSFEIFTKYGNDSIDFDVIKNILIKIKPKTLLDIGCGNGRLFPLYFMQGISDVIGQDISNKAINILKNRFPQDKYHLTRKSIKDLKYPDSFFDLVVSNRVLQSIPKNEIEAVIAKLSKISKYFYFNEVSNIDRYIINNSNSNYIIIHNYDQILRKNNFVLLDEGNLINEIGKNQSWKLYKKIV